MGFFLKRLAFLLLAFASFSVEAAPPLPDSLVYEQEVKASRRDLRPVDAAFARVDYSPVPLRGDAFPLYLIDWADRIYLRKDGTGMVILKAGVHSTERLEYGKLYRAGEDGFIAHLKATDRLDDAFYFSGISQGDAEHLLKALASDMRLATTSFWSALFPSAHADLVVENQACQTPETGLIAQSTSGQVLAAGTSCIKGIVGGVWGATGKAAWSVVKGTYRVLSHPIASFRAIKKEFKKAVALITHFGAHGRCRHPVSREGSQSGVHGSELDQQDSRARGNGQRVFEEGKESARFASVCSKLRKRGTPDAGLRGSLGRVAELRGWSRGQAPWGFRRLRGTCGSGRRCSGRWTSV